MLEYGIFNTFWNGHPNHLPLLSLLESNDDPAEWNLKMSIKQLDGILLTHSEESIAEGVKLLLRSDNWRPHLVAVLVMLKLNSFRSSYWINSLWERLKHGSWVSPQILVVLSMIDKDFLAKANEIAANGFKVTYSKMPAAEHHSARGPLGSRFAENKIIAAVHYLVHGSVIDSDEDDQGGSIARSWKSRLLQLIEEGKI
jgi:hypothetical protein